MLDIAPETNEVIDEIRRSVAALCEKFPANIGASRTANELIRLSL